MGDIGNTASDVLDKIISEHQPDRNPEDYLKGNILYCGKCHTAKQRIVSFPLFDSSDRKEEKVVRCMCKCESEERDARIKEEEYRQEMMKIERLREASLIGSKLRNASLKTFQTTPENKKLFTIVSNYVDNFDDMYKSGEGLLLWGPVGTGKSYAAACIANELLSRSVSVVMTSFVKILQAIGDVKVDESTYMARLNSAKLLILDDLGTERDTGFAIEKVYNIIDSRYLAEKPLILTTNLDFQEMTNCQDLRYKRVYDRIFEKCYPVRVAGNSWRMGEAAKRFDEMKKILEG